MVGKPAAQDYMTHLVRKWYGLKQDLAANTQPWTVVYFHHPPYTKTSHNSDTETELVNMRQRVVRILNDTKLTWY
jgi:hypothetical protein